LKENQLLQEDPGIWRKALSILSAHLISKIEDLKTISNLTSYIKSNTEEESIVLLNEIYNFMKINRFSLANKIIYPNQNGEFCLKSNLFIDNDIPEELKMALFVLSDRKEDIKQSLLLKNIKVQLSHKMELKNIYDKIDECILTIFNEPNRREM
jgi:hypothetical protein